MKRQKFEVFPERDLDYVEIVFGVEKPLLESVDMNSFFQGRPEKDLRSDYEKTHDFLKEIFLIKEEDELKSWRHQIFRTPDEVTVVLERKRIKLQVKSESPRQYDRILNSLKKADEIGVSWWLLRLDFFRRYKSSRVEAPLAAIDSGHWITRAGPNSHYVPRIKTKEDGYSNGAYFRSPAFVIACYNESQKVRSFKRKMKRLKNPDTVMHLAKVIMRFEADFGCHQGDIFKFEVRVLGKRSLEKYNQLWRQNFRYEEFCERCFEIFFESHRVQKDRKVDRDFSKFFVGKSKGQKLCRPGDLSQDEAEK
jgi:hypothetical protein